MKLREWLNEQERSIEWLSRQVDYSAASLRRVMSGETDPAASVVERIEKLTGGRVRRLSDLRDAPEATP